MSFYYSSLLRHYECFVLRLIVEKTFHSGRCSHPIETLMSSSRLMPRLISTTFPTEVRPETLVNIFYLNVLYRYLLTLGHDAIGLKSQQPDGYDQFSFPYFPPTSAMVKQGLNKRPSFFGSVCTSTTPATPLLVYIPNYNINFATNTSTFSPLYSVEDQMGFFNNGFAVGTQNQSDGGPWSSCLACALVDAQVARNGGARSVQCDQCFAEYCYRGTSDATA